jgi:hypothetical protein
MSELNGSLVFTIPRTYYVIEQYPSDWDLVFGLSPEQTSRSSTSYSVLTRYYVVLM